MRAPNVHIANDDEGPRAYSAAEIIKQLARLDEGDDPAQPVAFLIRCAKAVDWDEEPTYSASHMRSVVATTIRYVKWSLLIGGAVGALIGSLVTAAFIHVF